MLYGIWHDIGEIWKIIITFLPIILFIYTTLYSVTHLLHKESLILKTYLIINISIRLLIGLFIPFDGFSGIEFIIMSIVEIISVLCIHWILKFLIYKNTYSWSPMEQAYENLTTINAWNTLEYIKSLEEFYKLMKDRYQEKITDFGIGGIMGSLMMWFMIVLVAIDPFLKILSFESDELELFIAFIISILLGWFCIYGLKLLYILFFVFPQINKQKLYIQSLMMSLIQLDRLDLSSIDEILSAIKMISGTIQDLLLVKNFTWKNRLWETFEGHKIFSDITKYCHDFLMNLEKNLSSLIKNQTTVLREVVNDLETIGSSDTHYPQEIIKLQSKRIEEQIHDFEAILRLLGNKQPRSRADGVFLASLF